MQKFILAVMAAVLLCALPILAQEAEEYESIDSDSCVDCHEESSHGAPFEVELSHSVHEGMECLDCHTDKTTIPHHPESDFYVGCEGCRECHTEASDQYQSHGRATIGSCDDMPHCSDCHGQHDILPSSVKQSQTHPVNLPQTCGRCHEDLDLTKKYDILIDHPIEIYESSVHGKATQGGVYVAASCNDCHSSGGSAHQILSPGFDESSINHFKIPETCGQCHKAIEQDFWEGIHGQLVKRGETDAPVCTTCHGEHGILSHEDPRSPVSPAKIAEQTCSPCHESTVLNAKYGLQPGRLATFIDSYHGLKSKAGDTHVANCASCHGVHRILPSDDETSTIYPANLRNTCGDCHPGISEELAATPIHGVSGAGLRSPLADLIEKIYIALIVVVIGGMIMHVLLDLGRQIITLMRKKPRVRRMTLSEVWQHTFLMVTFIVLVVSGFALRFDQSWLSRAFFGWEGGFEVRGQIHRAAAVLFIVTTIWHSLFLLTRRGRQFVKDMLPLLLDFRFFGKKVMYFFGLQKAPDHQFRFSYVEKAEYWALVWGTAVMIITGLMLWFDNEVIQILPKGALDVALVVHYWEAWLATLAIGVWHLYATVFSPHVFPMNPSWLTGKMPEDMYMHEHPGHLEEARKVTEPERRYVED